MGFVRIGGILVPESSRPPGRQCTICGAVTHGETEEIIHARNHVKRDQAEEARRTYSQYWNLRELYEESDPEAAQWLKTDAGRDWFYRNTGPT